jgi:hypothetical protein
MSNKIAHNNTIMWIQSAVNRFENMYYAKLDLNGKPALDKAVDHLYEQGQLTVGALQYLFDRSHPNGSQPKYNSHRGYNKKYGDIQTCNLQQVIDSGLVNWTSAKNAIKPNLIKSIDLETDHEFYRGQLRKKPPVMADLFGE